MFGQISLVIFFSSPCLFLFLFFVHLFLQSFLLRYFRLFAGLALEAFLLFLLSKQGFHLSMSSRQPSLVRLVIRVRKVRVQGEIEGHGGKISGLKVRNRKL